jgi:hypothetical protein
MTRQAKEFPLPPHLLPGWHLALDLESHAYPRKRTAASGDILRLRAAQSLDLLGESAHNLDVLGESNCFWSVLL